MNKTIIVKYLSKIFPKIITLEEINKKKQSYSLIKKSDNSNNNKNNTKRKTNNINKKKLLSFIDYNFFSHSFFPKRFLIKKIPLSKYKKLQTIILSNIDLEIKAGEITAIIGTNGSGKSVLSRILSGDLMPTTGFISINGKSIDFTDLYKKKNRNKRMENVLSFREQLISNVTYLPASNVKLIQNMNFGQFFEFNFFNYFQNLYNRIEYNKIINFFATLLKFDSEDKNKLISDYSTGMAQKIKIIFGLLRNTDFIILDEVFNGIDDLTLDDCYLILDILKELKKGIIVISHGNVKMKKYIDKIIYIDKGKTLLNNLMLNDLFSNIMFAVKVNTNNFLNNNNSLLRMNKILKDKLFFFHSSKEKRDFIFRFITNVDAYSSNEIIFKISQNSDDIIDFMQNFKKKSDLSNSFSDITSFEEDIKDIDNSTEYIESIYSIVEKIFNNDDYTISERNNKLLNIFYDLLEKYIKDFLIQLDIITKSKKLLPSIKSKYIKEIENNLTSEKQLRYLLKYLDCSSIYINEININQTDNLKEIK